MINKKTIETKLKKIREYYNEMEPILRKNTVKEIKDDHLNLRSVERQFQLIVDSIIDVNSHIISKMDLPAAEDFQSTFEILGQNKVLPIDFTLKIAPTVGLRNKIVHEYDVIDKNKFINDLKDKSGDFIEYIRQVNKFLKKIK